MPIVQFRNLAQTGIVADPNPYELPPNAWSSGQNVRFAAGRAMGAPVWKLVEDALATPPIYGVAFRPSTGADQIIIVGQNGSVVSYANGTVVPVTPTGLALGTATPPYTSAYLGEVLFLNSPALGPYYYAAGTTQFQPLPGWSPTWTAGAMRSFGDYVVAMNVTKAGVNFPTMFKWSDTVLAGGPPADWDTANFSSNAGENILEQMESPIVDGLQLRDAFCVYSTNQVWLVQQTGNELLFSFTPLFSEGGLIAPNCVVAVNGQHFVFGSYDIYVHDGVTKQSIAENVVKEYIFGNMNPDYSHLFFAAQMPQTNEIMFAYVSGDADVQYRTVTGCNRAAVFNYAQNTWSFITLPNAVSAGIADLTVSLTWQDTPETYQWGTMGGTWYSMTQAYRTQVFCVSNALPGYLTNSRILIYDFMNKGTAPFPYIAECNGPAFLERIGLDLDQNALTMKTAIAQTPEGNSYANASPSDLSLYKIVKRIYPQVSMFGGVPVEISVGAQQTPSGNVQFGTPISFDPSSQYKIDMRTGGRYLAFNITVPQAADFEVAGFDADVAPRGSR